MSDIEVESSFKHLLGEVYQAIAKVKEVEPAYKEAQQQVHFQVVQLKQSMEVSEDLDKLIAYIYWFEQDIPLASISDAFGLKVEQIKDIACEEYPDIRCIQCGDRIVNPKKCRPQRSLFCNSCISINRTAASVQEIEVKLVKAKTNKQIRARQEEQLQVSYERREQEQKLKEEGKAARLLELRAMPYAEYLRTPEWAKKRRYTLQCANYRCQVCYTSEGTLDVHHRTYDRLGTEHYTDLIVLCRKCHATFHKNGKLAK